MTQPNQKAQKIRVNIPRPPVIPNNYKASGDANNGQMQHQRTKSKNKIPKNLRYDLENALVGLCDVWFEDIKPYLVRNNIKLHVNAGGGGEGAGGDRERLPPGAPGCSHLDPGRSDHRPRRNADCVDCCSTLPTASRVPFPKPPALLHVSLLHSPQARQRRPSTQNSCRNCQVEPKPRRRRKQVSTLERPRQLVPRLCRTLSTPPIDVQNAYPKTENPLQKQQEQKKTLVSTSKRKPMMKDKSTQTEKFVRKASPTPPARPQFRLGLRPATTTLSHPRQNKQHECPPLYEEDLVNIIAEKHDNYLKVLYKSPTPIKSSIMNLFTPSSKHRNTVASAKGVPPWK